MVFVLDKHKKPLMPCTEKRARLLRQRGRARVHRLAPYTIRLVDRIGGDTDPLALKIDPGSKVTGIALVREATAVTAIVALIELEHRGSAISMALQQRAGYRRRRRSANLRYRKPRFNNRKKPAGWLAPSLRHRIETTMSWVNRLVRLAPVARIVQELVRFDMQAIENASISGVEYQQGDLLGYEMREFVFEKCGRQCAYCDTKVGPFNLDHVRARSRGGSNRASNLVPACIACNERKGNRSLEKFLAHDSTRIERIRKQLKAPLRDAAAVNATRWALRTALLAFGRPVEISSGGRTKFNRARLGIPKTHAFDAVCTGNMDVVTTIGKLTMPTLPIRCMGRGAYQRTRVTACGFPRGYLMRAKRVRAFATGDLVEAVVPRGKHAGRHRGRVAVRATGSFNVHSADGLRQGINARYCRLLQRADGYHYERMRLLPGLNARVSTAHGIQ